jgi:hypothetical protein
LLITTHLHSFYHVIYFLFVIQVLPNNFSMVLLNGLFSFRFLSKYFLFLAKQLAAFQKRNSLILNHIWYQGSIWFIFSRKESSTLNFGMRRIFLW